MTLPMGEQKNEQELTPEELEKQNAEHLPDREVMSLINPGVDGIPSFDPGPPETSIEPVPPEVA
jgi:hypothetical protein